MPQFSTHLLHCHSLWHSVLIKSKGNIRAVALWVTSRPYCWAVSGPAFTLRGAGLHETLILAYRHTELTQRAVTPPGALQVAGFRATPQLSTGDNALITVTGVAIFSPLCAVHSKATADHTRTTRHFLTSGSSSARWAQATIAVNFINTHRSECTRRRLALINVDATVGPRESTGTLAPVPVITVHTRAAVIAWLGVAVVGILAAGGSLPSFFADTGEAVASYNARGSVLARVRQAGAVLGYITGSSLPSRGTHAFK